MARKKEKCWKWLVERLADGQEVESRQVVLDGEAAGYKRQTIFGARQHVRDRVVFRFTGFGATKRSHWRLVAK